MTQIRPMEERDAERVLEYRLYSFLVEFISLHLVMF